MDKARRDFLKTGAGATAGAAIMSGCRTVAKATVAPILTPSKSPNETIRVACIGIRGRGKSHIRAFEEMDNVEVVTLCDVDENIVEKRADEFEKKYKRRPKTEWDMRKVFDDPTIDVVSFATPNH